MRARRSWIRRCACSRRGSAGSRPGRRALWISRYGTLKTWANQLGLAQAVKLLDQTLAEEKKTDEALSALAESAINTEAA
jgi:hypothetical protein